MIPKIKLSEVEHNVFVKKEGIQVGQRHSVLMFDHKVKHGDLVMVPFVTLQLNEDRTFDVVSNVHNINLGHLVKQIKKGL